MLPILPTPRYPESGGTLSILLSQTCGLPAPADLVQQTIADSLFARRFLPLAAAAATVAASSYKGLIGDGSTLAYTITQATHGIAANGTMIVQVFNDSTGDVVVPTISINDANGTVTITFATAPSLNSRRVVILGSGTGGGTGGSTTGTGGENVLTTFSITGTGTYINTGISALSLPAAGTYLLWANLRVYFKPSANGSYIQARIYDTTNAAGITNSERLLIFGGAQPELQLTLPVSWRITTAGAVTIDLSAARVGTFTASDILSNSDGYSTFGYVRLS